MTTRINLQIESSILKHLTARGVPISTVLQEALENITSSDSLDEQKHPLPKREDVIKRLQREYTTDNVVIVLGAGVSFDYGLPSWNMLLQALLADNFKGADVNREQSLLFAEVYNRTFQPSPLVAARSLSQHYKSRPAGFETAVRDQLYQSIKTDYTSHFMQELVQLISSPGSSPRLNSVISYNFDDILEQELTKASIEIRFNSIFTIGQNPDPRVFPIYHVHGYIPRTGKLTKNNLVTLGEDIYHQQYTDIYNWANLVQLAKYKDHPCVFVGTSLTDPNQRRLLDIAHRQRGSKGATHFIIRARYSDTDIQKRLQKFFDANDDVFTKKVLHNISLKKMVDSMSKYLHRSEELDALSLGIETIWIDDHSETVAILKNMRSTS